MDVSAITKIMSKSPNDLNDEEKKIMASLTLRLGSFKFFNHTNYFFLTSPFGRFIRLIRF
jgi:hypothetical protein